MTAYVVGFDLSLTAPAAVALPVGWKPGDWRRVQTWLDKPPAPKSDDHAGRMHRYERIARWACDTVMQPVAHVNLKHGTPSVFIESYGFRQNTAQASAIMESGGIVRYVLNVSYGILPVSVPAATARKLLLGANPVNRKDGPQVNAKAIVQTALARAGAPRTWDENVCDAFVIANWGLTEVGGKALILGVPEPRKTTARARGKGARRA